LSDHDAQLITFKNITVSNNTFGPILARNINKNNIDEFQKLLSWEQWDNIFGNNNVNNIHNTYLRCFYACFPKKEIKHNSINNKWITKAIMISCKRKRELLLLCRHNDDLNLKIYYKQYCKILSKVIIAAKNHITIELFSIPIIK
jgi:hypothetical protein